MLEKIFPQAKNWLLKGSLEAEKNLSRKQCCIYSWRSLLETCDEKDYDNCPTPWDVCCEDRKKVAESTMSVRLLDANGSLQVGTFEGVSGLNAGAKIKVKGSLDDKSSTRSLIINAKNIQVVAN